MCVKSRLETLRVQYLSAGVYIGLKRCRCLDVLDFYILMRSWSISRGLMPLGGASLWNLHHINVLQIEFEKLYFAPVAIQ